MTIDLRQCKPGDRLRTRGGEIVTYERMAEIGAFPHEVIYSDGKIGIRTNQGLVWEYNQNEHDIVEIIGDDEKTILRRQLEAMRKVLHDQALLIAEREMEIKSLRLGLNEAKTSGGAVPEYSKSEKITQDRCTHKNSVNGYACDTEHKAASMTDIMSKSWRTMEESPGDGMVEVLSMHGITKIYFSYSHRWVYRWFLADRTSQHYKYRRWRPANGG